MEVVGVRVELPSNTPIVLLRELEGSHRMLPIFIGGPEATAIALALDEVNTPRPMTHDLIKNILDAQGVALARLEITELTNGTFYSEMYLKQDDASMLISARATAWKMAAALPGWSGTPTTVILASLRSCETPEMIACSMS